MKNSSFNRFSILYLLLLGLLVIGNTKAYSQDPCAATPPDPDYIEWADDDCIDIPLEPGCTVRVCYCSRTVNSVKEYLVKSFDVISGCDNETWADIIRAIPGQLARVLTNSIVPCSTGYTLSTSIVSSVCWKVVNAAGVNEEPNYACLICPEAAGFCVQKFRLCLVSNPPAVYSITLDSEFSDPGDCMEVPPAAAPWIPGQCYTVTPCDE